MSRETTYAGRLGDWRRLLASLEANAAELTHLEASRGKLETLWSEAVELNKQQAERAAAKQDASKRLQSLVVEGDRLATVLRFALKEHYGIRAEKLAAFGLQPFRGRSRKVKQAPEGPGATTPSPTSPPVTIPPPDTGL